MISFVAWQLYNKARDRKLYVLILYMRLCLSVFFGQVWKTLSSIRKSNCFSLLLLYRSAYCISVFIVCFGVYQVQVDS